ncbi:MAG: sigma-70 family RNA polymerase sigma factor [Phycisphaerae bacterium]|jgi:RNA polymerase sigma factor (sigma-70 family)|nr:sigma-70 family RNA polymerase sigma factor [Phycisphaerae bacterium]
MVALDSQQAAVAAEKLARKSLSMVGLIASRLHRWYGWVGMDDLGSYAYLGLVKAARVYQSDRGVPFEKFAFRKAMYAAIDEMRKDGVLKRRRATPGPSVVMLTPDIPDPSAAKSMANVERRDMCETLLGRLGRKDRQLLLMYYAEHMTFKQIAEVFDISESAVCLRHKALIERLRRLSRMASVA